jgi:hypothetical protein
MEEEDFTGPWWESSSKFHVTLAVLLIFWVSWVPRKFGLPYYKWTCNRLTLKGYTVLLYCATTWIFVDISNQFSAVNTFSTNLHFSETKI